MTATMQLSRTALSNPIPTSPARQAGSVRRTTNIDGQPDGDGWLIVEGRARDSLTTTDGTIRALDLVAVTAVLDPTRVIRDVTNVSSSVERSLVGLRVGRGFRAAVRERIPAGAIPAVLRLLLEDLPVAVLLSGYQRVYAGGAWDDGIEPGTLGADVCSGWRTGGTLMNSVAKTGRVVLPRGPLANPLTAADPGGWHDLPPATPNSMRRQRLLDVGCGTPRPITALVRDGHTDEAGRTTILHEWAISARYDVARDRFSAVEATPHVLPLDECPAAADSARRLSGCTTQALRDRLRAEFSGVSTCTHLTDLLGCLADIATLVAAEH